MYLLSTSSWLLNQVSLDPRGTCRPSRLMLMTWPWHSIWVSCQFCFRRQGDGPSAHQSLSFHSATYLNTPCSKGVNDNHKCHLPLPTSRTAAVVRNRHSTFSVVINVQLNFHWMKLPIARNNLDIWLWLRPVLIVQPNECDQQHPRFSTDMFQGSVAFFTTCQRTIRKTFIPK